MPKANTYETSDGLSFLYDHGQRKIVTANPGIFLGIVRCGERKSEKRLYLSIDNVEIQFSGPNGDALSAFQERDSDGVTIWEFGSIGVPFYYDTLNDDLKNERKRPASERFVPLAIDEKFNSFEQQYRAISYVQDFLSRYNDKMRPAWYQKSGSQPEPLKWFGSLPTPEDYILRRSKETLESILADGEWEGIASELIADRMVQTAARVN